eukprot:TRINITY_DN5595_c0_g8_i1.p1 TRINITY_DN5595_c0_g8~~TRINITY_DN5595_c0_g8_i1.p1  ORF type:complete len:421 (+),score=98.02 TRINITY_DN5595_c0_g8_i1:66-1265(+)
MSTYSTSSLAQFPLDSHLRIRRDDVNTKNIESAESSEFFHRQSLGMVMGEGPSSSSFWEGAVGWDLVNTRLEKSGLLQQRLPFPNNYIPSHIQDAILLQKTILKLLVRYDKTNKENNILRAMVESMEGRRRLSEYDEEEEDDETERYRSSMKPETLLVLAEQNLRLQENTIQQLQAENQSLQVELKRLILDFDRTKSDMLASSQQTSEATSERLLVKRLNKQLNVSTIEELLTQVSKLAKVADGVNRICVDIASDETTSSETRSNSDEEDKVKSIELFVRKAKRMRSKVRMIEDEMGGNIDVALEKIRNAKAILVSLHAACYHQQQPRPSPLKSSIGQSTSEKRIVQPTLVWQQLKRCLEQLFNVGSIDGMLPKIQMLTMYVERTWNDFQRLCFLLGVT